MQPIKSDGVKYIQDISYVDKGHCRQCLDLLMPNSRSKDKLPVVVFIHGGAYRTGDKSSGFPIVGSLAASGEYAAVSINYRYSSDAIWPAQIHDCKAAIRWIRANADKYGFDSSRIGVWGFSAGGHLAVMLGTSKGIKAMEGETGNNTDISSEVSCVVDFYGPIDFFHMDKFGSDIDFLVDESPAIELMGGPIHDNIDKVLSANPITYINGDEPPFLIIHGTKDTIVPYNQSELLYEALKAAKVSSTMITVRGGGHGNGFGTKATDIAKQFLDHYLRNIESKWQDKTIESVK